MVRKKAQVVKRGSIDIDSRIALWYHTDENYKLPGGEYEEWNDILSQSSV